MGSMAPSACTSLSFVLSFPSFLSFYFHLWKSWYYGECLLVPFSADRAYPLTQTSNIATCTNPNLSWASNSNGQSPCEIASILGGVCFAGVFDVPSLAGNQTFYNGPGNGTASDCECNTVRYSVLSACAACQSKDWLPWPEYSVNCDKVSVGDFPEKIPSFTKIPHYAFLPLGNDNRWDINAAQAVANAPESAGIPQVTVTLTPTGADAFSTVTVTAQPTVTVTPTASFSSSSKKSQAGAIAGIVIGCLVVIVLLLAFLFWVYRRKRLLRVDPPESFNKAMMTGGSSVNTPQSSFQAKLYDPSDPATFPSPPKPFMAMTSKSLREMNEKARYQGQPEI